MGRERPAESRMRWRACSAVPAGSASSAAVMSRHSSCVTSGTEAKWRQQSSQPLRQGQSPWVDAIVSTRS
jgi:hypothetical protein